MLYTLYVSRSRFPYGSNRNATKYVITLTAGYLQLKGVVSGAQLPTYKI